MTNPFPPTVLRRATGVFAWAVATVFGLPGLLFAANRDAIKVTNLLPNASFEEKATTGVPGWRSRAWHGGEHTQWSVEPQGRTGGQCVSIRSRQGADAAWTTTVTVRLHAYYRLSGWIKTKDLRGATGALLNIQNMQQVRTEAVAGTKDWTQVATVFRSDEATELEINCLFGGWGSSTGQAWYDDVALEQVEGPPDDIQATVTISADAPSVPYSRMIFGGFIEHFERQVYGGIFEPGSPLCDKRGFRRDVVEAVKELKVSVVRWPGGCFASGYHWKDGVGRTRKPTPDPVWGVTDPNTFGTDEFAEWCRLVGCEPYICTNAGNGTPEEMRDWVEYCNGTLGRYAELRAAGGHAKPYGVRFWSIGNENWGGHEIGASTPEKWGPLVDRSAHLMLGVDPKLSLLAAATPDRGWTLPLLKRAGNHLDYVWSISLLNRHPSQAAPCTVKLKDVLLDGRYEATILAGDSPEAFNDVEHPSRVVPEKTRLAFARGVTRLPPHSLAIVKVRMKQ